MIKDWTRVFDYAVLLREALKDYPKSVLRLRGKVSEDRYAQSRIASRELDLKRMQVCRCFTSFQKDR